MPCDIMLAIQGYYERQRDEQYIALLPWNNKLKGPQDLGLFHWEKDKDIVNVSVLEMDDIRKRIAERDRKIQEKNG